MSDFVMPDVEGWLTEEEGAALARYAEGKTVLEIGTYYGRSTICMARTAKVVYAVDTFDGRGCPQPHCTIMQFWRSLVKYRITNVRICVGTVAEVVPQFLTRFQSYDSIKQWFSVEFNMVFIDGAHDLESVRRDIVLATSVLHRDGLLAFHDYRYRDDGPYTEPEVSQAVNELLKNGGQLLERSGSVALVKPPM